MRLEKKRYESITLYLTLNCNLNCSYCFCGKKFKKDMSIDMLDRIIDFYNGICIEPANITFFGGEPLLKMDLIKHTIQLNKEEYNQKFNFSITTNGTLLTPDIFHYLQENNVNILLSLDGDKVSHDKNRKFFNGNGSWDVIMNNISSFCNELPVRMTFSRATLGELNNNVQALIEKGFKSVTFYPASGEPWSESDYSVFENQIQQLMNYFYMRYSIGKPVNSHWVDKSIKRHIANYTESCHPGINQMSVTPDGNIFPCNHTNFNEQALQIGNILEGIDETKVQWINDQVHQMDNDCIECAFRNRCNYCYINMYEETDTLWRIPDWYCSMNQIVIMNADLLAEKLYKEKNPSFMKKFYNK